jgi:hypothetical protein
VQDLNDNPVRLIDNWPLAGYVMKAFVELLNHLTRTIAEVVEVYSQATFEPPMLPAFESAKCTTAE